MISYRQADIMDKFEPVELTISADLTDVFKEEFTNSYYVRQYCIPYVWQTAGQNKISESLKSKINAELMEAFKDQPLFIGNRTIVKHDEGELLDLTEVESKYGNNRMAQHGFSIFKSLGLKVLEVEQDNYLEVSFKIKGPVLQ